MYLHDLYLLINNNKIIRKREKNKNNKKNKTIKRVNIFKESINLRKALEN